MEFACHAAHSICLPSDHVYCGCYVFYLIVFYLSEEFWYKLNVSLEDLALHLIN